MGKIFLKTVNFLENDFNLNKCTVITFFFS